MSIIFRCWDSDCALGYLNKEPDKYTKCERVLEKATQGEVVIVASAVILAEVIRMKNKPRLTKENEEKIKNFFKNDYFEIRDCTRTIAEIARQLMWNHDKLMAKDAIHVATAVQYNVNVLHTFDGDLLELNNQIRLKNGLYNLTICHPDVPQQDTCI